MTGDLLQLTAQDLMTRRAETLRIDNSIHDAIEKMICLDLSALPVVDRAGECVGVLTKSDIIRLAGYLEHGEELPSRNDVAALFFGVALDEVTDKKVADVMTKHVLHVNESDSIDTVADKMLKHEIHHVPVCNVSNQVVGMVSSLDLVKAIRKPGQNQATG